MADYTFLQNSLSRQWVVLASARAKRPDSSTESISHCPFCVGHEKGEREICRIGGVNGDSNWKVRVIPNKYPFAPNHEVIIHSPDHHKNFDELPLSQVKMILGVFRDRYNALAGFGDVYIFHNHGEAGGESLPHPHTQVLTIPFEIGSNIELLSTLGENVFEVGEYEVRCPGYSQWPDEVWIVPAKRGDIFGRISDIQLDNFAEILQRIIQLMDLRHGSEFPYNFYIYPRNDWYLRIIPRYKTLGGFEIGTNIFVNTQDPNETLNFIRKHYNNIDQSKIRENKAEYKRAV